MLKQNTYVTSQYEITCVICSAASFSRFLIWFVRYLVQLKATSYNTSHLMSIIKTRDIHIKNRDHR
jgi:hypothetical protein